MEHPTANTQPEGYLDLLLEVLACPVDNSISLTAIRNPDGEIVALKSKDREYPVVDNVPCMIPDLGESRSSGLTLWQKLQSAAWRDYQSGDEDVFSAEDDPMGHGVGQIISQTGGGLFLDVGCGALPLPGYMAVSRSCVSWIGIDPFFGDVSRQHPFVQALGECLPFQSQAFDGVLYAGTIDHVLDPLRSLERTRNIIKPEGKLYVWYVLRRVDPRYFVWKIMRTLGFAWRYNRNHQWAFTHKSLRTLIESAGFAIEEVVSICESYCPDYLTCSEPDEFLAIASCV